MIHIKIPKKKKKFGQNTSIKGVNHQAVNRLDSGFVKVTDGDDHDKESELWSRVKTDLGSSSQEQRTQVQGSSGSVRWDKLQVVRDGSFTGLDEQVLGDGSHAGEIGRVLHTSIGVGSEDANLTILAAESLDALKALLEIGSLMIRIVPEERPKSTEPA